MNPNSERLGVFVKAVAFAADKHRNQRRKDTDASPYINHPIALADALANEGGITDVAVLCAAVLHEELQRVGSNIASPRIRTGDGIYEALQDLIQLRIVNPGRDGQNPHALPLMKRCIFKPRRATASRDHQ